MEGPRAPTPDSFPDSFPALGDAEEELDGEVNAYGETVSTLGAPHEPPVSTTEGEDDGSDSRFYDTRVRGYEETVYEQNEDDGSDSIDPSNPVINVMRLPDAFVERHLWDLPELLTPHGRYPLEYNDGAVAHENPALEDGFQGASREPNDDRVDPVLQQEGARQPDDLLAAPLLVGADALLPRALLLLGGRLGRRVGKHLHARPLVVAPCSTGTRTLVDQRVVKERCV